LSHAKVEEVVRATMKLMMLASLSYAQKHSTTEVAELYSDLASTVLNHRGLLVFLVSTATQRFVERFDSCSVVAHSKCSVSHLIP